MNHFDFRLMAILLLAFLALSAATLTSDGAVRHRLKNSIRIGAPKGPSKPALKQGYYTVVNDTAWSCPNVVKWASTFLGAAYQVTFNCSGQLGKEVFLCDGDDDSCSTFDAGWPLVAVSTTMYRTNVGSGITTYAWTAEAWPPHVPTMPGSTTGSTTSPPTAAPSTAPEPPSDPALKPGHYVTTSLSASLCPCRISVSCCLFAFQAHSHLLFQWHAGGLCSGYEMVFDPICKLSNKAFVCFGGNVCQNVGTEQLLATSTSSFTRILSSGNFTYIWQSDDSSS